APYERRVVPFRTRAGRARYWGFTIVGVANGSPFMPPFFDPVLHVAGAGREFMWWRDGKLPSPRRSTISLPRVIGSGSATRLRPSVNEAAGVAFRGPQLS